MFDRVLNAPVLALLPSESLSHLYVIELLLMKPTAMLFILVLIVTANISIFIWEFFKATKVIRIALIRITAQKIKFPIKHFFSKCDQIHRKLQIWLHLLKKSLMENFIFCAVNSFSRALCRTTICGRCC